MREREEGSKEREKGKATILISGEDCRRRGEEEVQPSRGCNRVKREELGRLSRSGSSRALGSGSGRASQVGHTRAWWAHAVEETGRGVGGSCVGGSCGCAPSGGGWVLDMKNDGDGGGAG